MKKVLFLIFSLALYSCQKYERVNPLDPLYNSENDSSSNIELAFKSYNLIQKSSGTNNYLFDLYITIENTGNTTLGSVTNPIYSTISTSDQNISIILGDTKQFGGSSNGYEIAPNETKTNTFAYTLTINENISNNYQSTFNLTIKDDKSGKSWTEEFDIIINL